MIHVCELQIVSACKRNPTPKNFQSKIEFPCFTFFPLRRFCHLLFSQMLEVRSMKEKGKKTFQDTLILIELMEADKRRKTWRENRGFSSRVDTNSNRAETKFSCELLNFNCELFFGSLKKHMFDHSFQLFQRAEFFPAAICYLPA